MLTVSCRGESRGILSSPRYRCLDFCFSGSPLTSFGPGHRRNERRVHTEVGLSLPSSITACTKAWPQKHRRRRRNWSTQRERQGGMKKKIVYEGRVSSGPVSREDRFSQISAVPEFFQSSV
ncbi:hypothetical protein AOLI_G00183280 [Acnodon oligacanthus]